ncbi:MAG: hypothetical protein WCH37_05355, partial [Synechococcaceae cyanobacterium ELA182]
MPDSDREPGGPAALPTPPLPNATTGASGSIQGAGRRQGGWPLPVKILLAAVVVGFVWSPFLAMLVRLSN